MRSRLIIILSLCMQLCIAQFSMAQVLIDFRDPGQTAGVTKNNKPVNQYIEIAGNKWAPMNLGAKSIEEYGNLYNYNEAEKAIEELGPSWKLPTKEQFKTLFDQSICSLEITEINGTKGLKVSDKNDSTKYLFFPVSGRINKKGKHIWKNIVGDYWAKKVPTESLFYSFCIHTMRGAFLTENEETLSFSIRPVFFESNNNQ